MSGRTRARWGEVALVAVAALALVHHLDHVLRADYSGWPFTSQVTPFTASLLLYPALAAAFLLRSRPWARVALVAVVLGAVQVVHMFLETPARDRLQRRSLARAPGRPGPSPVTGAVLSGR